jgi:hypothetical protein
MHTQSRKAEIAALEIQVRHYENLLDQSIRNNEILAKTKFIYHDLKLVMQKLSKMKAENEQPFGLSKTA